MSAGDYWHGELSPPMGAEYEVSPDRQRAVRSLTEAERRRRHDEIVKGRTPSPAERILRKMIVAGWHSHYSHYFEISEDINGGCRLMADLNMDIDKGEAAYLGGLRNQLSRDGTIR